MPLGESGTVSGYTVTDAIEATVKFTPLLAMPFSVTTTFPVVAPAGTVAEMPDSDQHVPQTAASVPLNVTVLVP